MKCIVGKLRLNDGQMTITEPMYVCLQLAEYLDNSIFTVVATLYYGYITLCHLLAIMCISICQIRQ